MLSMFELRIYSGEFKEESVDELFHYQEKNDKYFEVWTYIDKLWDCTKATYNIYNNEV